MLKTVLLGTTVASALAANIVETAQGDTDLTTLVSILTTEGYEGILAALGEEDADLTVFAPTNDAFEALVNATGIDPATDVAAVSATLLYHVLPVVYESGDLEALQYVNTLMVSTPAGDDVIVNATGQFLKVTKDDDTVMAGDATVVVPDVVCDNGVVHVVDKVITVAGVDKVSDVASSVDDLSTLVSVLGLAELVDDVDTAEAVTIFAPTNEAFTAFLEAAGNPELTKDLVTPILLKHVIAGAVAFSSGLQSTQEIATLGGETVTIVKTENGKVTVNGATVTMANVQTLNGVVHIIDEVIALNPAGSSTGTDMPSSTGADMSSSGDAPVPSDSTGTDDGGAAAGLAAGFTVAAAAVIGAVATL